MISDACRVALVYAHLICFAFAISSVLSADLQILAGRDTQNIKKIADRIIVPLSGLWLTGILIIYVDTGLDWNLMQQSSKLVLKLACVIVLTLNGLVLHRIGFKILCDNTYLTRKNAIFLSAIGGLSTGHWLLSAFIGCAKPLASIPLSTLLSLYFIFCVSIVLVAFIIAPFLQQQLNLLRAKQTIVALGISHSFAQ